MLVDSEVDEHKRKLWENLSKTNVVDVKDTGGLQRLLTLVQMPSFIKDNTKSYTILPDIDYKGSLISSQNIKVPMSEKRRKSFFDNSLITSKGIESRLESKDFIKIATQDIVIDKELGYTPISPEIAVALRQLTLGTLKYGFSSQWKNGYFSFKDINGPLPYSLYCEKNSVRGLHICVQAFVLKNMLFTTFSTNESRYRLLNVSENRRIDCFISSLSNILWTAGEERNAFVCLPSKNCYVDSSPCYTCDKITETIHIFKFKTVNLLTNFLKKNVHFFMTPDNGGCILFLYSLILSRGLQELFEDFEFDTSKCLLSNTECLNLCAISLILTGRATSFLHNGVRMADEEPIKIQHGIHDRSNIGYLQYVTPEETDYLFLSKYGRRASDSATRSNIDLEQINVVGSMLKTPKYPIWVVNGNGSMGVIFCLNDELLTYWRAESNFKLHYLNGVSSQNGPCDLSICTRRGRTAKFKSTLSIKQDIQRTPVLNHIINTKWYGCRIDWNSTIPFI